LTGINNMPMEEHGFDQHHEHEPLPEMAQGAKEPIDQANKALVDALRVSFWLLKLLMIFAVILYLVTGAFQVKPEEVALVQRFGKVLGTGPLERELQPGFHWAWPYPIDHRIVIPKNRRSLNCEFWYMMTEQEKIQGKSATVGASLVPGKDNFVITSDANILHVSLIVYYRVSDAFDYVRCIENADQPEKFKQPESDLINSLACAAVVKTANLFKVDDLLGPMKGTFTSVVKKNLDNAIRATNCGLELEDVLIKSIVPPRQVEQNFNEVRNAAEQMHGAIQVAEGDQNQRLVQTAGSGYQELIKALELEKKYQDTSDPRLAKTRKNVQHLLDQSTGSVQEILAEAKVYRTRVVESAKADAGYLQALLPEYQKNPRVVLSRLLLGTLETSLKNVRKWYLPKNVDQLRMWIDRDPDELKNPVRNQQTVPPADESTQGPPPGPPQGPPPGGPPGS